MPLVEQITFKELLQDRIYKEWVRRPPQFRSPPYTSNPWRCWVQRKHDGPWAYKDFPTYAQAFNRLIREFKDGAWDGAVGCPSRTSPRPMVKRGMKPLFRDGKPVMDPKNPKQQIMVANRVRWVVPENHLWCPYCRRPTRWGYYRRHHAMKSVGNIDGSELRCRICGVRQSFVRRYHRA